MGQPASALSCRGPAHPRQQRPRQFKFVPVRHHDQLVMGSPRELQYVHTATPGRKMTQHSSSETAGGVNEHADCK